MASSMSWAYDAPTGTWKNQKLSKTLREGAFSDTQFVPFCTTEPMGKGQGETLDLYTVVGPDEPTSALLTEQVRIPTDTLTFSKAQLTLRERGRALEWTNKLEDLSTFQVSAVAQKRLRRVLGLVMDTEAATEFKDTYLNYIPLTATTYSLDTDGTPSSAAVSNLNLYHMQQLRDIAYGTYKIPFVDGSHYVMIAYYLGLRGIKNDPSWQQWKVYGSPDTIATGEVGQIETIRCIETNHSNALTAVGTGSVLGEAVLFGDEAVAYAEAVTPELRMKPKTEDYGRSLGCAWYGNYGFKLYHPTANAGEARVICITSA